MNYKSALRYPYAYQDPENKSDLVRYMKLLGEKDLIDDTYSEEFVLNCLMFSAALVDQFLICQEHKEILEETKKYRRYYQNLLTFDEKTWKIIRQNIQDLLNALIKEDVVNKEDYKQAYLDTKEYITDLYNRYLYPRTNLLLNYLDPDNEKNNALSDYEYAKKITANKKVLSDYFLMIKKEYPFNGSIDEFKAILLFSGALIDEICGGGEQSTKYRVSAQKQISFKNKYLSFYRIVLNDLVNLLIDQASDKSDYYKKVNANAKDFVSSLCE